MDTDLVTIISPNYISNTYIDSNNQNKNIPTQQVENQMPGCYVMYNKYFVQNFKTISEYYHKKLVLERNSF